MDFKKQQDSMRDESEYAKQYCKVERKLKRASYFKGKVFRDIFNGVWEHHEESMRNPENTATKYFEMEEALHKESILRYVEACCHIRRFYYFWDHVVFSRTNTGIATICSLVLAIAALFSPFHIDKNNDNTPVRYDSGFTSPYKFRVRFGSGEERIISGSVDMWKGHSWQESSIANMIDSIKAVLRIKEENASLKVRITGHADDTPRDDRRRDEVNNGLALARHDEVLNTLRRSLTSTDIARIQFNNPTVQWWDVDGYDARHSPGNNSDFRVALIEITY